MDVGIDECVAGGDDNVVGSRVEDSVVDVCAIGRGSRYRRRRNGRLIGWGQDTGHGIPKLDVG